MNSPHYKPLAVWLFSIAAMIFAMIILGGVTRLTHSGLSMVDWRPVTGWLPPLEQAEWERVFAGYRQSPEYKKINAGMSLADFKAIFWFEFTHRLLGRLIGVAFFVPMVFFMLKGWISRQLAPKIIALFILGGMQGALGWYMVKSGLVDRPDVSQYRLAAHLGLALLILGSIVWVVLDLVRPEPADAPSSAGLRLSAWGLLALIGVTALSGAFVAGLDAGHVYNTFPLMDGRLIPPGMFDMSPLFLNFFENIPTVQFDHRMLAMTTLVLIAVLWWRAGTYELTPGQRRAVNALAVVAAAQVALGITTLVLVVPVPLAVLHQGGAVILLGVAVWLAHELRAADNAGS